MGKEWDSFKETGSSKHFHSPDTETARGFGALTGGTPIKALPRFNSSMKEYQAWCKVWARALFHAMRSGGHILVFGGTRTVHRLTCALEDAGFEIRDMLSWVYGCLSADTEVLVNNEWKTYEHLREGDMVFGYNIEDGSLSWQPIQEIVEYDYDDTAYRIESKGTDQLVSRNHRVIVERDGKQSFVLAEELSRKQEIQVPILESLQGLFIDKPIDNLIRNSDIEAIWSKIHNSKLVRSVAELFRKRGIGAGQHTDSKDFVVIGVAASSKASRSNSSVRTAGRNLVDHHHTSQNMFIVVDDVSQKRTQLSLNVHIVESVLENQTLSLKDMISTTVQLNANTFLCERIMTRIKEETVQRIEIGEKQYWNEMDTNALYVGIITDLKHIISSLCKTIPNLDMILPMELLSATNVIITKSTMEHLLTFMANMLEDMPKENLVSMTKATVKPVHYRGIMWCVRVPTGAFVARRNGLIFMTGNSGFPKGLNVSKNIDKSFGLKQPVVGRQKTARPIAQGDYERIGKIPMATKEKDGSMSNPELQGVITQPISPEAQYWEGWNTVLKPAHEPIMLARKPISESSVVKHVLKHGLGAINIGECRVAVNPNVDDMIRNTTRKEREAPSWKEGSGFKNESLGYVGVLPSGRYPANLILSHHPDCKLIQEGETSVKDVSTHASSTKLGRYGIYGDYDVPVNMRHSFVEGKPEIWECVPDCPLRMLNEQSGITSSGNKPVLDVVATNEPLLGKYGIYGDMIDGRIIQQYADKGGAARFFYCPKPNQKERALGLDALGLEHNPHVTVKPIRLVRYLVRLITPFGGVVADPFLGAGTTAIAAEMEGFQWVGCDNNKDYCDIARARIEAARKQARAEP